MTLTFRSVYFDEVRVSIGFVSLLLLVGCGDGSGGVDAAVDASRPDDPDAGLEGISCESEICTGNQVCCVSQGASSCTEEGGCAETVVACDGPEDCTAEQVCCVSTSGDASCASSCETPEVQACHEPEDCDPASACCPRDFLRVCSGGPGCP